MAQLTNYHITRQNNALRSPLRWPITLKYISPQTGSVKNFKSRKAPVNHYFFLYHMAMGNMSPKNIKGCDDYIFAAQ